MDEREREKNARDDDDADLGETSLDGERRAFVFARHVSCDARSDGDDDVIAPSLGGGRRGGWRPTETDRPCDRPTV